MRKLVYALVFGVLAMLMAAPAHAIDAPTVAPPSNAENLTDVVKVKRGAIRIKGVTEPNARLIVKFDGKQKLTKKKLKANKNGVFAFHVPVRTKTKGKEITVSVYAKDKETGEMSEATELVAQMPRMHKTRTYTGAAVKNYCRIEGNSYQPVRGAKITAWLTTEKGLPIQKLGTTTTDSNGLYSLELPRNSNVLIQAYKENYLDKRDSILHDLRLNSKNGNINQHLYLCSGVTG